MLSMLSPIISIATVDAIFMLSAMIAIEIKGNRYWYCWCYQSLIVLRASIASTYINNSDIFCSIFWGLLFEREYFDFIFLGGLFAIFVWGFWGVSTFRGLCFLGKRNLFFLPGRFYILVLWEGKFKKKWGCNEMSNFGRGALWGFSVLFSGTKIFELFEI